MSDAQPVFLHVEIVHPDPNAAADHLERIFGGERVEKKLTEFINENYNETAHVRVGGVVFQYVKPPAELTGALDSWTNQLRESGPGIHNVTFNITDYDTTCQSLIDGGATMEADFTPIDLGPKVFGTAHQHSACCIDASELLGMRLELIGDMPEWVPGEAP